MKQIITLLFLIILGFAAYFLGRKIHTYHSLKQSIKGTNIEMINTFVEYTFGGHILEIEGSKDVFLKQIKNGSWDTRLLDMISIKDLAKQEVEVLHYGADIENQLTDLQSYNLYLEAELNEYITQLNDWHALEEDDDYSRFLYYYVDQEYETYNEEFENQEFWNNAFQLIWNYDTQTEQHLSPRRAVLSYGNFDTNLRGEKRDLLPLMKSLGRTLFYRNYIEDFSRDIEAIEMLWTNNNHFFYAFFSQSKYENMVKPLLDDLLNAYEKITVNENYKEHFTLYDINDDEFFQLAALENDPDFMNGWFTWPYSFWDRRYTEGNMTKVYEILVEIKSHYEH